MGSFTRAVEEEALRNRRCRNRSKSSKPVFVVGCYRHRTRHTSGAVGDASMESLLYGLKPTDGTTVAAAVFALAATAMLASFIPARRASRIDPITALRNE